MAEPIRVLLADDQDLVRSGFRMILATQKDIAVVGEASDGNEALHLAERLAPDVVVMDVRMPHLDGLAATRILVERMPQARVLVLTTFDLDRYVVEALRSGAAGFLLKDVSAVELIAGVRAVARGDSVLAPAPTRRLLSRWVTESPAEPRQAGRLAELSEREREILALVGRALSNREIAETLFVAESTVKTHINRMLRKLAVRDRAGLIVFAYETGLVRPGR